MNGHALKDHLIALGIDQSEAARRCGMSPATVHQHIKEKRSITAESAVRYEAGIGFPRWVSRPDLWVKPGGEHD